MDFYLVKNTVIIPMLSQSADYCYKLSSFNRSETKTFLTSGRDRVSYILR